jgi:rSAM/selenodomain-associated transferase 1
VTPPVRRKSRVVVFARAPVLGAVKTRLAAAIGDTAALRFHVATTDAILRRLARDRRWVTVLAVTPDRLAHRARLGSFRVARMAQGSGDLGPRMTRALAPARPNAPVVVVGSDIPALAVGHVARAFAALAGHDLVFGPAEDGGYWLVGARDRASIGGLFRGVRWSGPHALTDTLRNVPAHRHVALLETLADVDDGASFRRWQAQRAG